MNQAENQRKLELLIRIINELSTVDEESMLFRLLLTNALEFTEADRGFIIREDGETLIFIDKTGNRIEQPEVSISTIRNVLASQRPLCLIENIDGESITPTASILALNLKTIMCAPMTIETPDAADSFRAALYVDSRVSVKPFDRNDLDFFAILARQAAIVWKKILLADRLKRDFKLLYQEVRSKYDYHRIVGQCDAMKKMYHTLEMLRDTDLDVLITGETGTGKELIAKAIHYSSKRSDMPLVQLNCAALPEGLMEAELFGVERNVATDVRQRIGRLEQADKGTLFLDEIGDMPLHLQNRLLRFLEERCFRRIGGRDEIAVDVRVLAATNKDLKAEIAAGRFKDALRYRLDVVNIHLPPLRERGDDLELLAEFFLKEIVETHAVDIKGFTADTWKTMREYSWPGNVRELKHRVQSAAFLARGQLITAQNLGLKKSMSEKDIVPLHLQVAAMEKEIIRETLERHKFNKTQAAASLGISRNTLARKIRNHHIEIPEKPGVS